MLTVHAHVQADHNTLVDLRNKLLPGRSAMMVAATAASTMFTAGAALGKREYEVELTP